MEYESFRVNINRREAADLYADLDSLEVELDDDLASMFRLRVAIAQEPDGRWTHLDDERFRVWNDVTISAGFTSGREDLMTGYITHIRPYFDPDPTQCFLEIWGMDGTVLMDREEKLQDWPNKKDSDIAYEILRDHRFLPSVEDTQVVHDEAVSTIMQRETDMQFLKRLALRNGFECYVEGSTGYFRSPQLGATPQPVLAAHFGAETTLVRFAAEINALTPAQVTMYQVDRLNKAILEADASQSREQALGRSRIASPRQLYIGMNTATGNPEMAALCQALVHQTEWFVSGEGEIAGNVYGHVLKPRRTVTIKGVGETYSGVYVVTHVTHAFTADGYRQSFRVKRNAIMPTGWENFSASSAGPGGLL